MGVIESEKMFDFFKNKHEMISALERSFLYRFDVVLNIFGVRFSLGGCHEKVKNFNEKVEIS